MIRPPEADLEEIVKFTDHSTWEKLKDKSIFLTGGTGFFGRWLLEFFDHVNRKHAAGIHITSITRDPESFRKKAPHLFTDKIKYIKADVKDPISIEGSFDYVVHAATEASESLNNNNPLQMMDTIVAGTRNTLEFARTSGAKRMLNISSGAVYGRQLVSHIDENTMSGPDLSNFKNTYAEAKRLAELMCSIYSEKHGIEIPTARCFAFVGPYLNLDIHFAIGNFIRNGLDQTTIEIKGDGTPMRSYLYMSDLVRWLLTILVQGQSRRAYNVGSDEDVSIAGLAQAVCECFDNKMSVVVRQKPDPQKPKEQYVPSIQRAKEELGLTVKVGLKEAIQRTIDWNYSLKNEQQRSNT